MGTMTLYEKVDNLYELLGRNIEVTRKTTGSLNRQIAGLNKRITALEKSLKAVKDQRERDHQYPGWFTSRGEQDDYRRETTRNTRAHAREPRANKDAGKQPLEGTSRTG